MEYFVLDVKVRLEETPDEASRKNQVVARDLNLALNDHECDVVGGARTLRELG